MFIGQNPGTRKSATAQTDMEYIRALHAVQDVESLDNLLEVMAKSLPRFALYRTYMPDANLERIAVINVIRCRTALDAQPPTLAIRNCRSHITDWLDVLRPKKVVFVGVWASNNLGPLIHERRIKTETINRQRSLSASERQTQAERIRKFLEDDEEE